MKEVAAKAIFRGFIRFYKEPDVTAPHLSLATSQRRHKYEVEVMHSWESREGLRPCHLRLLLGNSLLAFGVFLGSWLSSPPGVLNLPQNCRQSITFGPAKH